MNGEKAKKKFKIFDCIIILVIAAIIAAAAYVLVISPAKKDGEQKQLTFVVEVQTTTLDVLNLVKAGDTVTLSGRSDATIQDVKFAPAQKLVLDHTTGKYKLSEVPEKFDVYATVTAPATETDKDISVGNTAVKVGSKLSLEGRGYSINGAVLEMSLYDENGEEIVQ